MGHRVDRLLARHETIDPMKVGQPHPKTVFRLGVLYAERNDQLVRLSGDRYLASDIFALVAMVGEHQQHRTAFVDRRADFVVERMPGVNVTGRDPAVDIPPFERGNDFHRLRPILTDMTDEQKWIFHVNVSICRVSTNVAHAHG